MGRKAETKHVPGEFRFKRFSVRNERSAMKVNTDGVILGAAMTVTGKERHILDIGTGTGTIALMTAQRLSEILEKKDCGQRTGQGGINGAYNQNDGTADSTGFRITGIDIDKDSAEEAAEKIAPVEERGRGSYTVEVPLRDVAGTLVASYKVVLYILPFTRELMKGDDKTE